MSNGSKNGRLSEDEQTSLESPPKRSKPEIEPEKPREPYDIALLKTYGKAIAEKKSASYWRLTFIVLSFADNPDTLICGNCKEMFHNLSDMINHKRHYCKLRFTCKCAPKISSAPDSDGRDSGMLYFLSDFGWEITLGIILGLGSEVSLLCSSCNENFLHPWDLLIHVQKSHSLQIYEETEEITDFIAPNEESGAMSAAAAVI